MLISTVGRSVARCYQDTARLDTLLVPVWTRPLGHTVLLSRKSDLQLTMAMSGVKLTEACKTLYDDIQKGKKFRWVFERLDESLVIWSTFLSPGTGYFTLPEGWSTWRRSGREATPTRTSWPTSSRRTETRTTAGLPVSLSAAQLSSGFRRFLLTVFDYEYKFAPQGAEAQVRHRCLKYWV